VAANFVNAKRVAGFGRTFAGKFRFPTSSDLAKCGSQPAHFRLLALLAFHFQLLTSGFSLKVFVLCLKRRTASITTLASEGNPFSAQLLPNS